MNQKKERSDNNKLWQINGGRTLKKHEYNIGIGKQVNMNKVGYLYNVQKLEKNVAKGWGGKGHSVIR